MLDERLADGGAAAEGALRHARRVRGHAADLAAAGLHQERNVEQLGHHADLDVVGARVHQRGTQMVEVARQSDDGLAADGFDPVSVFAQRLRHAAIGNTHERDLAHQVSHRPAPQTVRSRTGSARAGKVRRRVRGGKCLVRAN